MTEYPRITKLLDNCARWPDWRKYNKDLATELRALLAERDALTTKAQPVRKLREYYSETIKTSYRVRDGVLEVRHNEGGWCATSAINVKDVSAVADLMCDPYEPAETVEDVLREMCDYSRRLENVPKYAARLRAAVAAEGVRDV